MKEWDKVLLNLARISPPEYARIIRERNLSLLERLNMLVPYAGQSVMRIPGMVLDAASDETAWGCPHCLGPHTEACRAGCMWVKARDAAGIGQLVPWELTCAEIVFPCGASLKTMWCEVVRVSYDADTEGIEVRSPYQAACSRHHATGHAINLALSNAAVVDGASLQRAMDFVQDHVDWANLECWGSEYKE